VSIISTVKQKAKTERLAVVSLLFGIISLVTCYIPGSCLPAIICGHIAKRRIQSSFNQLKGNGMARAGLFFGYASLAISLLAVPACITEREHAHDSRCMNNLQAIQNAKLQAAQEQNYGKDSTIPEHILESYLPGNLSCPKGGEYTFNPVGTPPNCSVHNPQPADPAQQMEP
jgi:hypothetical protein